MLRVEHLAQQDPGVGKCRIKFDCLTQVIAGVRHFAAGCGRTTFVVFALGLPGNLQIRDFDGWPYAGRSTEEENSCAPSDSLMEPGGCCYRDALFLHPRMMGALGEVPQSLAGHGRNRRRFLLTLGKRPAEHYVTPQNRIRVEGCRG